MQFTHPLGADRAPPTTNDKPGRALSRMLRSARSLTTCSSQRRAVPHGAAGLRHAYTWLRDQPCASARARCRHLDAAVIPREQRSHCRRSRRPSRVRCSKVSTRSGSGAARLGSCRSLAAWRAMTKRRTTPFRKAGSPFCTPFRSTAASRRRAPGSGRSCATRLRIRRSGKAATRQWSPSRTLEGRPRRRAASQTPIRMMPSRSARWYASCWS